MRSTRLLDSLIGVGYLVVVAAFLAGALMMYNKTFADSTDIKLTTGTIGNALQTGSDVKLDGVPVGTVTAVEAADDGAVLTLALDPDTADQLSASTTARLLPKTLFGERYVSLVVPRDVPASGLSGGDTIHQDTSAEAVELEQVFDELLPVLQSIQPDKLSATLGELSTMLRGEGATIGESMASWGDYLAKMNPLVPQMADDFEALGKVATEYDEAVPDLLNALDTMTTTADTLVEQRTELGEVYANVIAGADTSSGWVEDNQDTIVVLSEDSQKALAATAPYATQFPCLFKAVRSFIPEMDRVLGKGTDEPGMHVVLNVVEARGKYVAGKDKVTYRDGGAPRCPYMNGQPGTKPARAGGAAADQPPSIPAPPTSRLEQQMAAGSGLGDANSPAENTLITEILAAEEGTSPSDYPEWSSLLVGPTLREAMVIVR
ncbi:MCE family protein [Mumia zhuanghuii]|uniref:MCE family protein n=2 Tax=Mumia TaxID=1546255 RepID=A0ABW1QNM1_9ACTN|nr:MULTISPECIES: MCE family protein [Mumia]KAA1423937.1 MCE family protein [Mumia zhuanghuii]